MTLRRRVAWLCIVAGGIAAAGFLALGLPGAVVLEAALRLLPLFTGNTLGPDQAWPAAIGISLLGPFALVPAYLAMMRLTPSRWLRVLATAAITLVADVAGSVAGLLLAVG